MSMTLPSRPTISDHLIMLALEKYHVEKKNDWVFEDIAKEYSPSKDGYELMRDLEKYHYWIGSRELMEDLDDVDWSVRQTHQQAIKDWVMAYDVQPKLIVGSEIKHKGKRGKVTDLDRGLAQYAAQFYEPLYENIPCLIGGNSSIRINYEDLEVES